MGNIFIVNIVSWLPGEAESTRYAGISKSSDTTDKKQYRFKIHHNLYLLVVICLLLA